MKLIPLSQSYFATVDDGDYEFLNQWKWYAIAKSGIIYAERTCRYGTRSENKKQHIKMHRLILGAIDPSIKVDHKDGDGLNNKRSNLRICTNAQNCMNSSTKRKYKGIRKNARCSTWSARIMFNGKEIYLGSFSSQVEAVLAYNKAAIEYFGEFARINEEV